MKSETISKIVKASGVSAGELVLVHFWGEDAEKEIANNIFGGENKASDHIDFVGCGKVEVTL